MKLKVFQHRCEKALQNPTWGPLMGGGVEVAKLMDKIQNIWLNLNADGPLLKAPEALKQTEQTPRKMHYTKQMTTSPVPASKFRNYAFPSLPAPLALPIYLPSIEWKVLMGKRGGGRELICWEGSKLTLSFALTLPPFTPGDRFPPVIKNSGRVAAPEVPVKRAKSRQGEESFFRFKRWYLGKRPGLMKRGRYLGIDMVLGML
ncbi:hypothetical protein CDAR_293901 [Caerostris darwini]|uniref:Uncharacterized protein n=1 Tax=Caerostris darwini TaxID=1538125 RepID=A0AAV4VFX6_9ARAC|nr:hypothetical protein CDAR_293901 [Caerostris darwini]